MATITVQDQNGDDVEVCDTCYSQPCYCQDVIDQGAGDWRPSAGDTARVIPGPSEEPEEEDDDPQCICGTYRSEHALLGCREGFQTPAAWAAEHAVLVAMSPEDYERYYGA